MKKILIFALGVSTLCFAKPGDAGSNLRSQKPAGNSKTQEQKVAQRQKDLSQWTKRSKKPTNSNSPAEVGEDQARSLAEVKRKKLAKRSLQEESYSDRQDNERILVQKKSDKSVLNKKATKMTSSVPAPAKKASSNTPAKKDEEKKGISAQKKSHADQYKFPGQLIATSNQPSSSQSADSRDLLEEANNQQAAQQAWNPVPQVEVDHWGHPQDIPAILAARQEEENHQEDSGAIIIN